MGGRKEKKKVEKERIIMNCLMSGSKKEGLEKWAMNALKTKIRVETLKKIEDG